MFDKGLGDSLREQALNRLDDAHETWIDMALAVVRYVAIINREFTTDDVWPYIKESPPEPRAMGAVMRKVLAAGIAKPTDRTIKSDRPDCHSRPIRVWRTT